jgi:hypothetical protein
MHLEEPNRDRSLSISRRCRCRRRRHRYCLTKPSKKKKDCGGDEMEEIEGGDEEEAYRVPARCGWARRRCNDGMVAAASPSR